MILNLGKETMKNGEQDIYLVMGKVIKGGEVKNPKGLILSKASIVYGKNKDGTDKYMDVNGWNGMAKTVQKLEKGTYVICIGTVNEREYNGRKYYDVNPLWCQASGSGYASSNTRAYTGEEHTQEIMENKGVFVEVSDDTDSDLPF